MSKQYFATLPPKSLEFGTELENRRKAFYDKMDRNGQLELAKKAHNYFYGYNSRGENTSANIGIGGEQGELSLIKNNQFRSLINNVLSMSLTARPDMTALPVNTDYKSQQQADMAKSLFNSVLREKDVEQVILDAMNSAIISSASFCLYRWNDTAGKELPIMNPATQTPVTEGDIEYTLLTNVDYVRETHIRLQDTKWGMARLKRNKYDLIAQYPELAEKIGAVELDNEQSVRYGFENSKSDDSKDHVDDIYVWAFYHKKTPAVPNGRQTLMISADLILEDTSLTSPELPIAALIPETKIGSGETYANAWSMLGMQDAIDSGFSALITNMSNCGVQVFKVRDTTITREDMSGMTFLNLSGSGDVEPMQPFQVNESFYKGLEMIQGEQQKLAGTNDVARGNVEHDMSGSAMALQQSMAIQANGPFQRAISKFIESLGTGIIRTYRDNMKVPMLSAVAGVSGQQSLQEFTSENLQSFDRFITQIENPATRTEAYAMDSAKDLLQLGGITPTQYLEVKRSGKLDIILEGEHREALQIKSENELLSKGTPVQVLAIDDHVRHILEHKSVAADPQSRQNPQLLQSLLQHINDHINQLKTADPALMMILKQPLLAPPPPGAQGSGGPGGPANPPNHPGQHPSAPPPHGAGHGPGELPAPPTNPLTGQQAVLPKPQL